ncbi:MAG: zinc-ribbon domain-containing protein [Acidimicrobiales bacterium]
MTDTIGCPHCGAQLPAAAAFCTSCGQRVGADQTLVDTPGLNDPTQVVPPVAPPHPNPPAPPEMAPPMPTEAPLPPAPTSGPWGPTSTASVPDGPPTTAPWDPPANPPPPSWQQPTPPMEPQAWAGPGGMAPASVYGTAPAPAGAPTGRRPSIAGGLAAIVGAILTIAGVFSGWVTLRPEGSRVTVSMWSLASGDGFLKTNDPYVLIALAGCAGLVGLLLLVGVGRTVARILAILIGLGILGLVAADWMSISNFVQDHFPTSFQAQTAVGLYLAVAGGIVTIIAGLLPAKKA